MNSDDSASEKKYKKRNRYFEIHIFRLLKKLSTTHASTANAKQQLNSALGIIVSVICKKSCELVKSSFRKTITIKELKNTIFFLFPRELAHACDEFGSECVQRYEEYIPDVSGVKVSRQDKAGIIIPPSICEIHLRETGISISSTAPVYLASVIEYLTNRILTHAIREAITEEHARITIRDLELAVRLDPGLNDLFKNLNIQFLGGGVIPCVHESLLNKKPRRVKKDNKKRRFRPGTVSLREIKKFQKTSNCLTFTRLPFERLVRATLKNVNTEDSSGLKVAKGVFLVLQHYIEQYITCLLQDSNSVAIHCGRVKMTKADILFINRLRGNKEPNVALYTPILKEPVQEVPEAVQVRKTVTFT